MNVWKCKLIFPTDTLQQNTEITDLKPFLTGENTSGLIILATTVYFIDFILPTVRWLIKGIVHFEIKIWYLSAYPKGIQDVGVFFSSVDPILMFLGQTVLVCQSYNGRYRSLSL